MFKKYLEIFFYVWYFNYLKRNERGSFLLLNYNININKV